jgi:formylglycine-generating enzyme required for sulfatase activity
MRNKARAVAVVAGLLATWALAGSGLAQEARPAPAKAEKPAASEVTIVGNVLSNVHTGEKDKSVFLLAYDGTPQIKAEFDKIVAEHFPDKGLDADAAVKLQDQFMTRLTYHVDGPLAEKMWKDAQWTVRGVMAVTGVVTERDGKRWLTASKCEPAKFTFPAKMLAPDKPLVMPGKEPLVLKLGGDRSLRCLPVPAGTFLMGEPYYQCPHWQEDPPHRVTLTRSFYMSETPITQEIYEAVMGTNPSRLKGPKLPVHNVSCADVYKFCQILSQKTGRKVRPPTAAEWEYAARIGTSNPTFPEKYAEQNSNAKPEYGSPPLPVGSKKPNAWGFSDMHSGWWERVGDAPVLDRQDTTDPQHTPPEDKTEATRGQKHTHVGKGQWTYAISEIEYITSEPGDTRFRIVVEAEAGK